MKEASVGSDLKMDRSYIDIQNSQAICCWIAPSRKAVEDLFKKAKIPTELILEVTIH